MRLAESLDALVQGKLPLSLTICTRELSKPGAAACWRRVASSANDNSPCLVLPLRAVRVRKRGGPPFTGPFQFEQEPGPIAVGKIECFVAHLDP